MRDVKDIYTTVCTDNVPSALLCEKRVGGVPCHLFVGRFVGGEDGVDGAQQRGGWQRGVQRLQIHTIVRRQRGSVHDGGGGALHEQGHKRISHQSNSMKALLDKDVTTYILGD